MSDEKTEQPTPKKLRDARKKGDVAYSKDFTQTVLIVATFGYLVMAGASMMESLSDMLLAPEHMLALPFREALGVLTGYLLREAVWFMVPFLLIVIGLGILSDGLQVGVVMAFEKIKPNGKKLNVVANLKNIFSAKNVMEFVKSLLKILFLSALLTLLTKEALPGLVAIPQAGVQGIGTGMGILMKLMFINLGIAYVLISGADLFWQRYQYFKQLRMTKDEVKREYKEMEGDPHIKQKRRDLRRELAENSSEARAASASVLVTNPTHIAIALYYEKDVTLLPVVMAKAEGPLAERMREAARAHGVPIMRNVPLARALMAGAPVERFIPGEFIEPVVEVLKLVNRLRAEGGPLEAEM
ncbi:EscU/YscU/HrcU family type III secretion system export apparatus switch protein [Imbroritus primus]|uniref:EscU/YscU/HrcU family type III secretion system export apparatus switch protein n=1 Tax=Imbroritus primus TaxID=3058603 RepID=A0ACD3SPU9_9BURK|nr:EscU/YscU/HrcU family type III secretion system export apparatus switch protein [Burkholderiaceae bacterium PBA]